jgi:hypothetical protein
MKERKQFGKTFDFNNAEPTGATFGQSLKVTEGRYLDAVLTGYRQNRLVFPCADIPIVNLKREEADRIYIAMHFFAFDEAWGSHFASLEPLIWHAPAGQVFSLMCATYSSRK